MILFTTSIQKYIAVILMSAAMCFGMYTLVMPTVAQAQTFEQLQAMIDELTAQIAVLNAQAEIIAESTISIGDTVLTKANLVVRATPAGQPIGIVARGTGGTVIAGPFMASNTKWWHIEYRNGLSGWSASSWLSKINQDGDESTPLAYSIENANDSIEPGDQNAQIANIMIKAVNHERYLNEINIGFINQIGDSPVSESFENISLWVNGIRVFKVDVDDVDWHKVRGDIRTRHTGTLYSSDDKGYGIRIPAGVEIDAVVAVDVSYDIDDDSNSWVFHIVDDGIKYWTGVNDQTAGDHDVDAVSFNIGDQTPPESDVDVLVEVVDTGAYVSETSSVGGHGEFEIKMDVTAFGDDIFIYQSSSLEKDGVIPVQVVDGAKGNSNEGDLTFAVDTSGATEGAYIRIDEGETETITVEADFNPERTLSYSMQINTLPYTVGSAGGVIHYVSIDDAQTEYIRIQTQAVEEVDIRITAPNGGEEWVIGDTNTITWSPYDYNPDTNAANDVDVYLEKKVGKKFIEVGKIMDQGKASLHTYFELDKYGNYANPGMYYVRAVNRVTGASDRSDKPFTLVEEVSTDTLSCDVWTDKDSYDYGEDITVYWAGTGGTYMQFIPDKSGKDYIKVPTDKLNIKSKTVLTANVLGNPSIVMQIVGAHDTVANCKVTFAVIDPKSNVLTIDSIESIQILSNGTKTDEVDVDLHDGSEIKFAINYQNEANAARRIANKLEKNYSFDFSEFSSNGKRNRAIKSIMQVIDAADVEVMLEQVLGASIDVDPYIVVESPNGSEVFTVGETVEIAWSSAGVDRMSLALYKDNKWLRWIEKDMPIQKVLGGTYSWTIPQDVVDMVGTTDSVLKIYTNARKTDITGYVDDKSDTTFAFNSTNEDQKSIVYSQLGQAFTALTFVLEQFMK